MKKIVSTLAILLIAVFSAVLLSSCGGETIVPGSNWAQKETFIYNIIDNGTKLGTLTITSEKLDEGSYSVPEIREEPFKITSAVMRGVRYEQIAKDNDGNILMHSIGIMNGFSPLASYKKVNSNNRNFETRAYVDGKEYRYATDGNNWKKIKIKPAQFIDNEILYMSMRSYSEIDSGYSKAITVIDPYTGGQEKISAVASNDRNNFTVNYTDITEEQKSKTVSCISVSFTKST
ncbi:MAG: hypothetical protein WC292_01245, partial [Clostridia bacterium]